jgi:hypothetical protein
MGVGLPTADDVTVRTADGTELVRIENESVHLLPFIGGLYMPNERYYAQAMFQLDIDASGSPVYLNNLQGSVPFAGRINDSTYFYASLNAGCWLYRGSSADRLSGISPVVELHYNKSLTDFDTVSAGNLRVGEFGTNFEMINAVAGVNFEFFRASQLQAAYVAPLTQGNDRVFDGEFRVSFNRFFY